MNRARQISRLVARVSALVFILGAIAAPVLAQANPQEEAATTTGWIYRWINFSILIAVLVWFFAKKAPPFFRNRQREIAGAIAESARARQEAERQQAEAQRKMASLDSEIADMRARAAKESAAEGERIRALAQEEAKRIRNSAQGEIRAAERAAQTELRVIATRLAMERASAMLRERINTATESELFSGFVAELEEAAQ
ncbi:MAG TPA: ATP synthase F0 subunit B [Candidatus Acidoferrales bacterium]|nr:ATP synthase F0 subunit B [Candidatus Acidoferrales bacterium]